MFIFELNWIFIGDSVTLTAPDKNIDSPQLKTAQENNRQEERRSYVIRDEDDSDVDDLIDVDEDTERKGRVDIKSVISNHTYALRRAKA